MASALRRILTIDEGPRTVEERMRGRDGLTSKGFVGIAATQFLTAFNDNAYRWLIIPIGIAIVGESWESTALSIGLAIFVIPYIVLVSPAGYLADRFPKRSVMSACMLLQAAILVAGVGAILLGSVGGMFATLAVMGVQGALLSPARSGAVPESVSENRVSAANGVCGLAAVAAAVVGTVTGNQLYVFSKPQGHAHWLVYAAIMIGAALVGWAATRLVEHQDAADPERAFPRNPFEDTLEDLQRLWKDRRLFGVACASCYFWFLAALVQVNIYLFGTSELHVRHALVGPLLGLLALGASVGAVVAGVVSYGRVRLELTPASALGMAVSGILIDVIPARLGPHAAYIAASILLFAIGFAAGFYDVPLQSYLQTKSPIKQRGRILAASTSMAFLSMLISSGIFWLLRHVFHLSAGGIFMAVGIVTVPISVVLFASFSPGCRRWLARRAVGAKVHEQRV
jgi:acyl-[acyl-carrier-protein]-phospholipid O-acyltransferase / long-chain-fatty-acid--[acyl-carrier-protein] ligase